MRKTLTNNNTYFQVILLKENNMALFGHEKCERKKIGRKNGRKMEGKKNSFHHFLTRSYLFLFNIMK